MEITNRYGIDGRVLSRISEVILLTDNFNPKLYVENKVTQLHKMLSSQGRTSLVVGVSGGIDSAVVLGILKELDKKYPNTYNIITMLCPIHLSEGTTEQKEAYSLGEVVIDHFGYTENTFDLSLLSQAVRERLSINTPYVQQQMDYWLRPMAFYKMAMEWENSIMISTVNGSEWSLGWFSQYLDVFGIHPIIELLKGDVYKLATYFEIPESISNTPPKGGLSDASTDEEALGFTYAEFEAYLRDPDTVSDKIQSDIKERIETSDFKRYRFNLDFIKGI